ncbi:hypothetical protein [uncultured Sphingomonas sp.]|uniref:hypothetical protein n=1 Tax=uncultured Sphingomonas sp. TaxID=158754 RepID=UPI00258E54B2|nr:hypothetical protein [uncultured Sphingomonas sp.]
MQDVDPTEMRLPRCPIPTPGERVRWFAAARPMVGTVLGHDAEGQAIVKNEFGNDSHVSFDNIRLADPFSRAPPNWHSLPAGGRLLKPDGPTSELFKRSMAPVIPPGPSYQELAEEIWGRGFEIFLVGGTVRDILAGQVANDIDLVTTMPLRRMVGFLKEMFQTKEEGTGKFGYIRLGGRPASGDPFIDLKVFSNSMSGTEFATFGVGFERDVAFRDFACNAVYYDPINEVIVDPTGHGVKDCASTTLRLVDGRHERHQMGQVFIRAVKFVARGFQLEPDTKRKLVDVYLPKVAVLRKEMRRRYFCTQVMSKHKNAAAKSAAVASFRAALVAIGCDTAWDDHFQLTDEDLQDA